MGTDFSDYISALTEFAGELRDAADLAAVTRLGESMAQRLPDEGKTRELFDRIKALGTDLARLRCTADTGSRRKRLASLSPAERAELERVEKILDGNLFTYHFQPIVDARTGEIYSYEALMRAKDSPGITPFLILKYAELTGRLDDIEKSTFINILRFIDENLERFGGRPVFINSIPDVRLSDEDTKTVNELLLKNSKNTVVEMTEESEIPEEELDRIKEKYRRLGIRIAIDDYGTGYSNVKNLLRYTPNFVKIDRSLLAQVHNDPQKRHFVREIIGFCHENGMLALAEGVETSEELRSVILFGIDLIQGYYTARPSAEIVDRIPGEIRQEIKRYYHEREDGFEKHIYLADRNDRIFLERLMKSGYDCIRITPESGDEVHIHGESSLDTEIHIEVADGFCGRVVLDNTHLSNIYGRPCIDIEPGCDPEIECTGHIRLDRTGICVPEGAAVRFTGGNHASSLDIFLDAAEHYGIGNDLDSRHGRIEFDLDTTVEIKTESQSGVLIGSGLGGEIVINKGRYILTANGADGVCIGSFGGDVKYDFSNCDLQLKCSGARSVCLGSQSGSMELFLHNASTQCVATGDYAVAIGCLGQKQAKIHIDCTNTNIIAQASNLAALGSFGGESDIFIEKSVFRLKVNGFDAYAFGGRNGGRAHVDYCDAEVSAESDHESLTVCEDFEVTGGSCNMVFNGEKLSGT